MTSFVAEPLLLPLPLLQPPFLANPFCSSGHLPLAHFLWLVRVARSDSNADRVVAFNCKTQINKNHSMRWTLLQTSIWKGMLAAQIADHRRHIKNAPFHWLTWRMLNGKSIDCSVLHVNGYIGLVQKFVISKCLEKYLNMHNIYSWSAFIVNMVLIFTFSANGSTNSWFTLCNLIRK